MIFISLASTIRATVRAGALQRDGDGPHANFRALLAKLGSVERPDPRGDSGPDGLNPVAR